MECLKEGYHKTDNRAKRSKTTNARSKRIDDSVATPLALDEESVQVKAAQAMPDIRAQKHTAEEEKEIDEKP